MTEATVKQLAEWAQVSESTIRRLAQEGTIRPVDDSQPARFDFEKFKRTLTVVPKAS